jgi:hypothetical protein
MYFFIKFMDNEKTLGEYGGINDDVYILHI